VVASFEASPNFFWSTVYVRFPGAEEEIARHENFDDELAQQERDEARANDKKFAKVYDDAKPGFDRLFSSSSEKPPRNLSELVARLQINGGAFWS